jgi:hypothetical protein
VSAKAIALVLLCFGCGVGGGFLWARSVPKEGAGPRGTFRGYTGFAAGPDEGALLLTTPEGTLRIPMGSLRDEFRKAAERALQSPRAEVVIGESGEVESIRSE